MDPNRSFDRPYGQPDPTSRSRYAPRQPDPYYPSEEAAAHFHAAPQETTGQWASGPDRMTTTGRPEPDRMTTTGRLEPAVPRSAYRARRPAVAVVLIVAALAIGLLLVRALAIAAFGDPFLIGGVIASSLALAALPLVGVGLYALINGAARGVDQWGARIWARPPLAYLLIGLAFLIVAGLAIS